MFQQLQLRGLTLPGRILRAATFENMAEPDGKPGKGHAALYVRLALGGAGTIITGFAYTSLQGRAAQRFQAGIDAEDKVEAWKRVIGRVKQANPETKIILQMAHTGRQTISAVTGRPVVGAGPVRCTYFLSTVRTLTEPEAAAIVREFGRAVARAARAGFDAVQIHAAHGYLIHQFLSPHTNRRKDRYGDDPLLFLKEVLTEARSRSDIPVLLKMSGAEDRIPGLTPELVKTYVGQISRLCLADAVEISYGTMEYPLNIIRGGIPVDLALKHNRLFTRFGAIFLAVFKRFLLPWYKRRFLPYHDLYNIENAVTIKAASGIPILVTGGIRTKAHVRAILAERGLDGVTMSRPFIREPDIVSRFRENDNYRSLCTSCNLCTVMSDSLSPLRCYQLPG